LGENEGLAFAPLVHPIVVPALKSVKVQPPEVVSEEEDGSADNARAQNV
jgi:hypothetical protein